MNIKRILVGCLLLLALTACTTITGQPIKGGGIPESQGAAPPMVQMPERNFEPFADPEADTRVVDILADFRTDYRAKNKPRLAIFLNRNLSDEIREWKTESRDITSGTGSRGEWLGESSAGETAHYTQQHVELEKAGSNVSKGGIWAFEDGFLQPFLETGSTVLDRATIMRLTALSHGQGDAYNPITVKRVEMEALKGNADIFIEVLILQSSGAPWGYEFKAVAKMVQTGQIVASTNSRNWDLSSNEGQTGGYFVKRSNGAVPDAYDLSRELALHLMESFMMFWDTSAS
jgi:hypothetical protein